MSDDQFWRIVTVSGGLALIGAFWPQIRRWLHKIGYRDWRDRDK